MNSIRTQLLADIDAIDAKIAKNDPKLKSVYFELRKKKEAELARLDAFDGKSTDVPATPVVETEPGTVDVLPIPTDLPADMDVDVTGGEGLSERPQPLSDDEQL